MAEHLSSISPRRDLTGKIAEKKICQTAMTAMTFVSLPKVMLHVHVHVHVCLKARGGPIVFCYSTSVLRTRPGFSYLHANG